MPILLLILLLLSLSQLLRILNNKQSKVIMILNELYQLNKMQNHEKDRTHLKYDYSALVDPYFKSIQLHKKHKMIHWKIWQHHCAITLRPTKKIFGYGGSTNPSSNPLTLSFFQISEEISMKKKRIKMVKDHPSLLNRLKVTHTYRNSYTGSLLYQILQLEMLL